MHEDIQLYDAIYDKRVECKALNIPEELGQVNIITISTSDQFSICLFIFECKDSSIQHQYYCLHSRYNICSVIRLAH